ncbi:MAG: FadR/GntR family transcriptional regulator [Planctomycetota bacterium]|nr:FadR/GntR family transcriptional regulator [Planctomycetota bacterium]
MPIVREKLPKKVAARIERMIFQGKFKQGDQLPPEHVFVKKFGVSRATVNEAINRLEHEGLVTRSVGVAGTRVTGKLAPDTISNSLRRYVRINACTPEELIDFRLMLEPDAAAMAAGCATEEDIAKLAGFVDLLETYFDKQDMKKVRAADLAFHEAVVEATHNELAKAVCAGIHPLVYEWMELIENRLTQGVRAHREIFRAIAERDAVRASRLMRDHLLFGRELLLKEHK